jgi:hypothetical protein
MISTVIKLMLSGTLVVGFFIIFAGQASNVSKPLSSCLAEPEPDNDWESHRGPIESIRIEDAELALSDEPLLRQVTKFNDSEQKVEKILYRDDGVALPKSTYTYDSIGRIVKAHHYQVNGTILLEDTYAYDRDGWLKDQTQRNLEDDKILNHKVYSHDAKLNLTQVSEFDWDNKLRSRIGFIRDGQCRITEAFGYDPSGSIKAKIRFMYDDRNNVIASISNSSDGILEEQRKYEYRFDNRGNWIAQISSKLVKEGGREFYRTERATYRRFTYH